MMDHSPSGIAAQNPCKEPVHPSRVLTSTSGNAQVFAGNSKVSSDLDSAIKQGSRHPSPLPILGSNDRSAPLSRLAARKAKRVSLLSNERQYLQSEQYQRYRTRKRQDIGDDGKPVWPDHLEESFQNALIHIPPMGRRKRSQHGRLHGRNELIAEWIKQETGEKRDRKQISSHLQVLKKVFHDVPEWSFLTSVGEDDDEHQNQNSSHGYYSDSIADAVRLQRELRDSMSAGSWLDGPPKRFNLSKVAFELWVGTPGYITQALHNYTRIPHIHSSMPAAPLESFDHWRELFPDLERTLQLGAAQECDLVLVRSSLALMSDFPPKTSKLGLVLDLDFRSPDSEDFKALSEMKYWSSINTMYLHGKTLRRTEHRDCQSAEYGLVKPFFEADWWAEQFTKLTHKRKEAEENLDGHTSITADDYSRNLFRELSIMQEVFASPFSTHDASRPRRRMAILLWVFSQANKGQAGVSSWQRVIPPPSRAGELSPLAPAALAGSTLPPLVLDSMVESSFDSTMTENGYAQHDAHADGSFSPAIYGVNSYSTGFTPLQTFGHDHFKFYDFASTGFTPPNGNFAEAKDETFDLDAALPLVPLISQSQPLPTYQQAPSIFDELTGGSHIDSSFPVSQGHLSHNSIGAKTPNRHQRLANFDVSTHQMLQAQLDSVQPRRQYTSQEDFVMVEPESQQSVVNHMHNLELEMDDSSHILESGSGDAISRSRAEMTEAQPTALFHTTAFESPKISRPSLFPHNSFVGVLPTASDDNHMDHEHAHLSFGTPKRSEYARLSDNHYVGVGHDAALDSGAREDIEQRLFAYGSGLIRPRSQPALRSNTGPIATCHTELVEAESGSQIQLHQEP